jgi:adenylylsulfate kinase
MFIIQMTGLSGAGKSTLATALKQQLEAIGVAAEVIDADSYRQTICKDLGFSAADRRENIRRLGRIANDYKQKGIVAIIAAINPFEDTRAELREQYGARTIWIRCDLGLLIKRDTKGLYRKALLPDNDPEKIWNLSGVNDPYEVPLHANLVIDTGQADIKTSTQQLITYVNAQINARSKE